LDRREKSLLTGLRKKVELEKSHAKKNLKMRKKTSRKKKGQTRTEVTAK